MCKKSVFIAEPLNCRDDVKLYFLDGREVVGDVVFDLWGESRNAGEVWMSI